LLIFEVLEVGRVRFGSCFFPHQSPITNHQSPITNHQSPITNHQSPITNHQSPIINHQSPSDPVAWLPFPPDLKEGARVMEWA
jgi:hypothetical protein